MKKLSHENYRSLETSDRRMGDTKAPNTPRYHPHSEHSILHHSEPHTNLLIVRELVRRIFKILILLGICFPFHGLRPFIAGLFRCTISFACKCTVLNRDGRDVENGGQIFPPITGLLKTPAVSTLNDIRQVMALMDQVHVIADGRYSAESRTSMLQIPTTNEELLCRIVDVFQIHIICNQLPLLCWHVDILMGKVQKPQIRMLSSSYNDNKIRSKHFARPNAL